MGRRQMGIRTAKRESPTRVFVDSEQATLTHAPSACQHTGRPRRKDSECRGIRKYRRPWGFSRAESDSRDHPSNIGMYGMKLPRKNVNAWLINRHQDIDRRARMHAQLQRFGLNCTYFRAIDGLAERNRLRNRADEHAYRRNMGSDLLPGKMGVYASHLAVWKALCRSSFDAGLIFEDDVILHDDFVEALDAALGAAAHWDLVRFCCVRAKFPISHSSSHFGHIGAVGRWIGGLKEA